ncbi:MAG: hypothetical protein JSS81_19025 [Acidobacteria bacterium]|nr:hypothetical protein [Acidobacteriota bacterium]
MRGTTFEKRVARAVDAFFAEEDDGETSLTRAGETALLRTETAARIDAKGALLVKILKRGFLFFPGALYLFFFTFTVLAFDFLRTPFAIIAMLIGSFLTIFGLGSLKNPKHLVIPASIVSVAAVAFAIFASVGGLKFVFEYGVYFFPLALVAPVLARNLVDRTDRAPEN